MTRDPPTPPEPEPDPADRLADELIDFLRGGPLPDPPAAAPPCTSPAE